MMASKSSKSTKKDLEERIKRLEADLERLEKELNQNIVEQPQIKTPPKQETPPQVEMQSQQEAPQTTTSESKSRKESLEEYEKDYLERMAKKLKEEVEIRRAAEEIVAKKDEGSQAAPQVNASGGSMPKGWQP